MRTRISTVESLSPDGFPAASALPNCGSRPLAWRGLAIRLAVVIMTASVVYLPGRLQLRSEAAGWPHARNEARRLGLICQPRTVKVDQDAGPLLLLAWRRLAADPTFHCPYSMSTYANDLQYYPGPDSQEIADARAWVSHSALTLGILERASHLSAMTAVPADLRFEFGGSVMSAADLLGTRATLLAIDHHSIEAVRTAGVLFRISRILSTIPDWWPAYLADWYRRAGIGALCAAIEMSRTGDRTRLGAAIEQVINRDWQNPSTRDRIIRQARWLYQGFEKERYSPAIFLPFALMFGRDTIAGRHAAHRGSFTSDWVDTLETGLVQIVRSSSGSAARSASAPLRAADLPFPARIGAVHNSFSPPKNDLPLNDWRRYPGLILDCYRDPCRVFLPLYAQGFRRTVDRDAEEVAQRAVIRAAARILQQRTAGGCFPDSAANLPADPYSGAPVTYVHEQKGSSVSYAVMGRLGQRTARQYVRASDGFVVYSRGEDGLRIPPSTVDYAPHTVWVRYPFQPEPPGALPGL